MKTVLKIFCFFLLFSPYFFAQNIQSSDELGLPLIRNYVPKEYFASGQNWAIVQDNRGIMYFGNVNGVLEYDGVNWRTISVPNDIVRCLAIDENGKIFVGGINEVGYLQPDSLGTLKYNSLNHYILQDSAQFGDIWRLIVSKDGLYIQTFSTIFLLQSNKDNKISFLDRILKKPKLIKWVSKTRFNPIHTVYNRIFVHERNVGLQELVNGNLKMLPSGEAFAQDLICVMLPFQSQKMKDTRSNKILIGSLRRGMYLFNGDGFEKFQNEAEDYLIKNRLYYRGAVLRNGSFALGTQIGGVVIIDKDGKWKRTFDKSSGLNNSTVWDLFPDREGNLWAALDNGISKILYPYPANILDERAGFEGTVNAINKFNGRMFISTTSGIYYIKNPNVNETYKVFYPVENISVQSWYLLPFKNNLLAGTNDGVVEIINNTSSIIDVNLRYAITLAQSKNDSSIIYVGLINGLAILKIRNNTFTNIGTIPNFQDGVTDIVEDEHGNLWLSDVLGKIILINTPDNKEDLVSYKKNKVINESILREKTKMFVYNDIIYFYDSRNIFSYDKSQNIFINSSQFDKILKDSSEKIIQIFSDGQSLWYVTDNEGKTIVWEVLENNNQVSLKSYSFLETIGEDFAYDFTPLKIYVEEGIKRRFWISGGNILVNYDLETDKYYGTVVELKPLIRKVTTSDKKVIFDGFQNDSFNNQNKKAEILYSQSSILFDFALPSFLNETSNDYQYKLEGFDQNWSSWSNETRKEYTNLSSGDYTFKLRSRNALGEISTEASFNFKVPPPWYKTWWANLIGFLIVLSMIYYVIRFRVRYLEKRNIILEKTVKQRTAKINEQKTILEDQAKKLKELDQLKSNFFANISHEFRTPLTLIKGQIESLLEKTEEQSAKKKLNLALTNSNRLHKLINQVLNLSRLESGTINLDLQRTEIVSFVKNRVAAFESLAEQKRIELNFNNKINSQIVYIDQEKMEEVIDNILANALKFTREEGRITVTTEMEENELQKNILFSIEDTGIGIPEEKLLRIFSRFFQIDSSSTKEQEGTGLGLAIVKEIIDLHAGTINVESKVDVGTKFIIKLPIEDLSRQNFEDTEDTISFESDSKKDLILIVEDNFDLRGYIKENLENHYNIIEACDGQEGIDKAIKLIPDLIISDLMMPKVDGFQLCEKLKNDQRTSHIPIIMLTARADEKSKLEGLRIGADEYLSKPFSAKELELRVGNLIRIRQLLREKYREISILKPEEIKASSLDREFVEKVFYIIKNHLEDNQFGVQFLADEIGMSVSQLNRKLNALINQTAGKLIRLTKLEYAAKLIESKTGNISEIAFRIGFADLSSFTNSFKEKYGVSPTEYLKSKNLESS